jgi:hypothetical protein
MGDKFLHQAIKLTREMIQDHNNNELFTKEYITKLNKYEAVASQLSRLSVHQLGLVDWITPVSEELKYLLDKLTESAIVVKGTQALKEFIKK